MLNLLSASHHLIDGCLGHIGMRYFLFLQAELAQQHAEEAKLHAEEAAEAASPSKVPAEAQRGAPAPPAHAAVESMHEQLIASQQRLQAVEAGLQGLHRQLADQQAKLGALQGHPKLSEESSEPLQQQLTQQQAAIAALQKSAGPQRAMEALQKQVANQQAELATLREAVASASLPELHRQLLAAQAQLRRLQQQSESLSSSQAQAGLPEEVEVRINKVELTVAGENVCGSWCSSCGSSGTLSKSQSRSGMRGAGPCKVELTTAGPLGRGWHTYSSCSWFAGPCICAGALCLTRQHWLENPMPGM